MLLRKDIFRTMLEMFPLKAELLEEEDGSVTLALDQLDMAVNAPSLQQAVEEIVRELKIYARDYILQPFGDLFIRLIRMVVVPLVVSSLIAGAAGMSDTAKFGRVAVKSFGLLLFYHCRGYNPWPASS